MLHKETVNHELIEILQTLSEVSELQSFRLVGGTAAAMQIGHRKSIDIDFFSNEKINKVVIASKLFIYFPDIKVFIGTDSIRAEVKGVRVELYDDWHTPFKTEPIILEGMRIATLKDLGAFKLEAITGRREKKDYIDLYFIFETLGAISVLNDFRNYNPYISMKSILFALGEVDEAQKNKSIMPELLTPVSWEEVEKSMIDAAKAYLSTNYPAGKSQQ
jgi:hypothetical protein